MRIVTVCFAIVCGLVYSFSQAAACPQNRVVATKKAKVVQVVQVQQAIVAVPVFVPVATYTASYIHPQQHHSDSSIVNELKLLRQAVEKLNQDDVSPVVGTPKATEGNLQVALQNSCVKCHFDGTAVDKGGGFVIFDKEGKIAQLTPADKARIQKRVNAGSMPPKAEKALTDGEKKLVVEFFK